MVLLFIKLFSLLTHLVPDLLLDLPLAVTDILLMLPKCFLFSIFELMVVAVLAGLLSLLISLKTYLLFLLDTIFGLLKFFSLLVPLLLKLTMVLLF